MKKLLLLCLLAMTLCLCGCWDKSELSEIFMVSGVALDPGKDGQVQVTLEILQVTEKDEKTTEPTGAYFTASGDTVAKAIEQIGQMAEKRLFWAHNQVVILGEAAAREQVSKYLDFFMRENDINSNAYVAVSQGEAAKLLQSKVNGSATVSTALWSILHQQEGRSHASVESLTLHDYARTMHMPGFSSSLPYVVALTEAPEVGKDDSASTGEQKVGEMGDVQNSQNSSGSTGQKSDDTSGKEEKPIELQVVRSAVFHGKRMIDILTPQETEGMLWLHEGFENGIVVVPGFEEGEQVSLRILDQSRVLDVAEVAGEPVIQIKVSLEAGISEQSQDSNITLKDNLKLLENQLDTAVSRSIAAAVNRVRELQVDFLGFGFQTSRLQPKIWQRLEGQWEDYLPQLVVNIDVQEYVISPGSLKLPLDGKKEDNQ